MDRPSRKYTHWISVVTGGLLLWMAAWLMAMRTFTRASEHLIALTAITVGAVVGVAAIARLAVLHVREVRRWMEPGTCSQCGYDLRGLDAGGTTFCPECGAAFSDRTRRRLADASTTNTREADA